jgi:hypothetical protein
MKLEDILTRRLTQGEPIADAHREAVREIASDIASRLNHQSLEIALDLAGLDRDLAPRIRNRARDQSLAALTDAMVVVISGGSAGSIPTAECLSRHLPPDRDPSREEIDEAIRKCRAESGIQVF